MPRVFLAVLALASALSGHVLALDLQNTTVPGRQPGVGGFGTALTKGEVAINRADKTLYFKNVDGSIGLGRMIDPTQPLASQLTNTDVSGMCAKHPNLGACRTTADRARDQPNVMDAPGVVCDGVNDDTAGIQSALNYAASIQGTVRLPMGKTCAISAPLTLGRAGLLGGGVGSSLKPIASMTDMVKITATLSSIRDISFINNNNLATNAIGVSTDVDALLTWIERNYFTGFPGTVVHHERGQHLIVKSNVGISNANFFIANNDGVNDVIEDNYQGPGGNGITFQRTNANQNGTEGAVIRGNVIFAQGNPGYYALKVTSNIDMHVHDNTFESDCNTVIYDGSVNGVSFIHQTNNWIGSRNPVNGRQCAALVAQNQVVGLTSINDVIAGRGQQGVLLTASGPDRPVTNISLIAPIFEALVSSEAPSIDIELNYVSGITIDKAIFSGATNIKEGPNVLGRIDASTFTNIPSRAGGLVYGKQVYMAGPKKMVTSGSVTIAVGQTRTTITHGLAFQPDVADVALVPYGVQPTNTTGAPYIVATSPTTITVDVATAPAGNPLTIGWKADNSR